MNTFIRIMIVLLLLAPLTGCRDTQGTSRRSAGGRPIVVTTLFPLYDFARSIAGDRAEVTLLLPPGVEPHSFEPRPEDMIRVARAGIFIYTNERMEPWARKLLQGAAPPGLLVVDASRGITLQPASGGEDHHGHEEGHGPEAGRLDPHVWLDFANARTMAGTIADALKRQDPAGAATYDANLARLSGELEQLDREFKTGLADCRQRVFLHGGHYAFGYLARRYGLTYRAAQALNPDAEPTPATIAGLLDQLRHQGLGYVFSEELLAPRTAEMLARETGARILPLHAAHNISRDDLAAGETFARLMRRNLANLRTGLGCR